MIVLKPTKILQNPVQDITEDLTGTYRIIVLSPLRCYKILSKILLKILLEPLG